MNLDTAAPQLAERSWSGAISLALRLVLVLALLAIIAQAAIAVRVRPQDLITGAHGMADIIRRAMPPDFAKVDMVWRPTLETIDLGIFGTVGGVILALPLAVLAAANVTPSRFLYFAARGLIGFARAVPDLVWALLFVTPSRGTDASLMRRRASRSRSPVGRRKAGARRSPCRGTM